MKLIIHPEIISSDRWLQAQSLETLTEAELGRYREISENKKKSWLLGRIAAKESALNFFLNSIPNLTYKDIEINNTKLGVPYLKISCSQTQASGLLPETHLSISHCDNYAVANIVPADSFLGAGVDIERIQNFKTETVKSFMTESELSFYKKTPAHLQDFLTTLTWSIKESYLKACGTGIRIHPNKVEIGFDDADYRNISIKFEGGITKNQVYWTKLEGSYIVSSIILL